MTSHSLIGLAHLIAGALSTSDTTADGCPMGPQRHGGLKLISAFVVGLLFGILGLAVPALHWACDRIIKGALDDSNKTTVVFVQPNMTARANDGTDNDMRRSLQTGGVDIEPKCRLSHRCRLDVEGINGSSMSRLRLGAESKVITSSAKDVHGNADERLRQAPNANLQTITVPASGLIE